jgi:uncharacterized protein YodC (DUF2158 family)
LDVSNDKYPDNKMELNVGDVVSLNSGGPLMTIKRRSENTEVECQWFDGQDLRGGAFEVRSLTKAEKPQAAVVAV